MLIGAILGGAADEDCKIVERLALNLGVAFQIQDDILDVAGNEAETGKPVGSDGKNEKTTYVTLEGLDKAREDVKALSEKAVQDLGELPGSNEFLEQLIRALIEKTDQIIPLTGIVLLHPQASQNLRITCKLR